MGKNSGGVTDWHKQQHKKQLIKNKGARIAARDERVVQEKTVQDIRDEIRKTEHHCKNEQHRPHARQSKLDRLKKELKLVAAKEEADKQQNELSLKQKKESQKFETEHNFIPLARPEVSIYYHPLLNPFGAPPPGQPRLYHRHGGGTTIILDEACSLQEQFLPRPLFPPPPPPPRPVLPTDQRPPQRNVTHQNSYRQSVALKNNHVPGDISDIVVPPISTVTTYVDPTQLPSLPAPSAAVARSKRNKLSSDIWASNEEIKYEEIVSSNSLEGISSTISVHTQWYYKDMSGVIQGPYTTDQMLQWNQAGYFPISTLVSGGNNFGPWKALKDIKQLYEQNSVPYMKFSTTSDVSSSVQDRIAALRNSRDMHNDDEDGIVDDVDVSLQMRIAALKAAPLHSVATPDPHTSGKSYDSCDRANSTVGSEADQNKAVAAPTDRCDIQMNEKANGDSRITSESGDYNALLPSLPPPASKNEAMAQIGRAHV